MTDTIPITCSVLEVSPMNSGKLLALASVELEIAGVAFEIHGIHVSRALAESGLEGVAVTVPRFRASDGTWQAAMSLPDELRGPMADVVLARCIELGIVRSRIDAA